MTATDDRRRRGAGAGRTARTVALLLLAAAAAPSHGDDDFSARSLVSYGGADQDSRSSRSFHQGHDLSFRRPFSDAIRYRLSLRYDDDRGSNVAPGQVTDATASRALRPVAELSYHLSPVNLAFGYDLIHSDAHSGSTRTSRRDVERIRGGLRVSPQDWPSFSIEAERRATDDLVSGMDQAQAEVVQTLAFERAGFNATQGTRYQRFDDRAIAFERTLVEASGELGYAGALPILPRGALSVSNRTSVTRSEEASLSTAIIVVGTPVTGGLGIYSRDERPGTSPGVPMSELPALTDGNVVALTGVSLASVSFQNLGVDMRRFDEIDTLRIYVRTAAQGLVPEGGPVTFDVFTSADAITWFPALGRAATYNGPGSYYEVTFPPVTARYFKAVSFGVNPDTFVTEVQPLVSTTFNSTERRSTTSWLNSSSLTLTTSPVEKVQLRYAGFLNVTGTRAEGLPSLDPQYDADQIAAVSWQALEPLRLEARYQRRELTRAGQPSQRTNVTAFVADAAPRPELRHTVTLSRTDDDALGRISHTNAVSLSNTIVVYRTLDLALSGGFARQLWPDEYQRIDRWFVSAVSNARLTPELKVILTAAAQRSTSAAPLLTTAGLVLPVSRDEQYAAEVSWHPTSQINVAARLGYTVGSRTSGLTQRYRVFWDPFPGGAIQFGGSVDQEVDATSDSRFSRVNGFLRWNVNRRAAFDALYNTASIQNHLDARNASFAVSFTLKL